MPFRIHWMRNYILKPHCKIPNHIKEPRYLLKILLTGSRASNEDNTTWNSVIQKQEKDSPVHVHIWTWSAALLTLRTFQSFCKVTLESHWECRKKFNLVGAPEHFFSLHPFGENGFAGNTKCPCDVSEAIGLSDCACCLSFFLLLISWKRYTSFLKDTFFFPTPVLCLLCMSLRAYLTCGVLKDNSTAGSTGSCGSMELHSRHGSPWLWDNLTLWWQFPHDIFLHTVVLPSINESEGTFNVMLFKKG